MNKDKYYVLSTPNYTLTTHSKDIILDNIGCCSFCLELYKEEFGEYPASIDDLLWTPCGAEYSVDEYKNWEDYIKYIKEKF